MDKLLEQLKRENEIKNSLVNTIYVSFTNEEFSTISKKSELTGISKESLVREYLVRDSALFLDTNKDRKTKKKRVVTSSNEVNYDNN